MKEKQTKNVPCDHNRVASHICKNLRMRGVVLPQPNRRSRLCRRRGAARCGAGLAAVTRSVECLDERNRQL